MVILRSVVNDFISQRDTKGVVVFSSMAPIFAKFGPNGMDQVRSLVDYFSELSDGVNVLMPSFPEVRNDSVINLDKEPSTNGLLTEKFRERFPLNRTVSRFFPFTVRGPDQAELFKLRPSNVWGEGSLYSWIEANNLEIITIGLPPYVCSVQHRAEFLQRKILQYRHEVQRMGEVVVRGQREMLRETLMVRRQGFDVDFRPLSQLFERNGQRISNQAGLVLTSISARAKISLVSQAIADNPLICVRPSEAI